MDNKQNFLFYDSWWDLIHEEYECEQDRKELIYAICKFGRTGEKTYPLEKMFLKQAYVQIEIAKDKHNKRSEAGKKGGESGKGTSKARYGNKNASKTQANDNDNDNANDNGNVNDNDNNNALFGNVSYEETTKAQKKELTTAEQIKKWKDENGV